MSRIERPHILLFNPDQWRGDIMGCHGNPAAVTPHLDAFVAKEAVSFRNAFCQNPVCTPSRCSFMTGWYPHVRGHRTMYHMLHREHGEPNLLSVLKDNGYFVWWGGKNDLIPGQEDLGFSANVKFEATEEDFRRWGCTPRPSNHGGDPAWRGDPDGDNYFSFFRGRLDKGDEPVWCDPDWQAVLGAIDFINAYEGDKPLCIYLPILYPHPPYCVEEPYYSAIERGLLPPRVVACLEEKPLVLQGIAQRQRLEGWSEERWDELRACYYAMCARVDHQFDLVTSAFKNRGIYDDTAVFFFSDHGDYTGDYGIVEKTQNTFEDCLTRVPFVVKPPAGHAVAPRVCDALVELVDLTATVYHMTGIDPGHDAFGRSLLPVVAGETEVHRDAVFCEGGRLPGEEQSMEKQYSKGLTHEEWTRSLYYPRAVLQRTDDAPYHWKAAMCRTDTHKYVRRMGERDELYDLVRDPQECRNVIDDPEYAGILAVLKERMLDWYLETADVVPRNTDQR